MRRGSTPHNFFTVPMDLSGARIYISYQQDDSIVIEKTNEDVTFSVEDEKYIITTQLSQEETLAFHKGDVLLQIRYVFPDGTADGSKIKKTTLEEILKDGVIRYV